jgi:hypothetical protein
MPFWFGLSAAVFAVIAVKVVIEHDTALDAPLLERLMKASRDDRFANTMSRNDSVVKDFKNRRRHDTSILRGVIARTRAMQDDPSEIARELSHRHRASRTMSQRLRHMHQRCARITIYPCTHDRDDNDHFIARSDSWPTAASYRHRHRRATNGRNPRENTGFQRSAACRSATRTRGR